MVMHVYTVRRFLGLRGRLFSGVSVMSLRATFRFLDYHVARPRGFYSNF